MWQRRRDLRTAAAIVSVMLVAGCRAVEGTPAGDRPTEGSALGPLGGMGSGIAMTAATHDPYVIAYRAAARRLRARRQQLDASDTPPAVPMVCFPASGCLPAADQAARAAALDQPFFAAGVGNSTSWHAPGGEDSGTATLTGTFTADDGAPCVTFAEAITLAGRANAADGAACLEQDHLWHIVDVEPRPPAAG